MTSPAAQARASASRVIVNVIHGRSLEDALEEQFRVLPTALVRERPLIQEMAYGTLRSLLGFEKLLPNLLARPIKDEDDDLRALLHVGLYQLLSMRVAPHAAVKETVEAVRVLKKDWAKGFVNAVLRRVLREQATLREELAKDKNRAHPSWLVKELRAAWPEDWDDILDANNHRPPMALRVHTGRLARTDYLERLKNEGLDAHAHATVGSAVLLAKPQPVEQLPGFAEGLISVQDAAAQLAAPLLDARPGQRVLDACAAPGGKAAHLLECVPSLQVTALDIDARRLQRVAENFSRLGVHGHLVAGDAARPADWWDGQLFDRILLDAPCSATGVIRRHPDIRLHRTPDDIERLAATQQRLLSALWPLLAPGGKLLYVTCSVLPRENDAVVAAFLAATPGTGPNPLTHPAFASCARTTGLGQAIRTGCGEMDGFFYCMLTPAGNTP